MVAFKKVHPVAVARLPYLRTLGELDRSSTHRVLELLCVTVANWMTDVPRRG